MDIALPLLFIVITPSIEIEGAVEYYDRDFKTDMAEIRNSYPYPKDISDPNSKKTENWCRVERGSAPLDEVTCGYETEAYCRASLRDFKHPWIRPYCDPIEELGKPATSSEASLPD